MRLAPDFVGSAKLSASRQESWFYVTMTGFTCPGIIAQYDFSAGEERKRWQVRRTMKVKGLHPRDFESQQVRLLMLTSLPELTKAGLTGMVP
jgi:prolyl oligopeptidase